MLKKIKAIVKLQVAAGKANPSPPIGPALGQQGINIISFCKEFNSLTANMEVGLPIPVVITIYADRSFTFIIKSPPASILLKKAAGIKSGSAKPNKDKVGTVNYSQLLEIAKIKINDMTGSNINAIVKSIKGTAKSIGLLVEEDK